MQERIDASIVSQNKVLLEALETQKGTIAKGNMSEDLRARLEVAMKIKCDKKKRDAMNIAFKFEMDTALKDNPVPEMQRCKEWAYTGYCQYRGTCRKTHIPWNVYDVTRRSGHAQIVPPDVQESREELTDIVTSETLKNAEHSSTQNIPEFTSVEMITTPMLPEIAKQLQDGPFTMLAADGTWYQHPGSSTQQGDTPAPLPPVPIFVNVTVENQAKHESSPTSEEAQASNDGKQKHEILKQELVARIAATKLADEVQSEEQERLIQESSDAQKRAWQEKEQQHVLWQQAAATELAKVAVAKLQAPTAPAPSSPAFIGPDIDFNKLLGTAAQNVAVPLLQCQCTACKPCPKCPNVNSGESCGVCAKRRKISCNKNDSNESKDADKKKYEQYCIEHPYSVPTAALAQAISNRKSSTSVPSISSSSNETPVLPSSTASAQAPQTGPNSWSCGKCEYFNANVDRCEICGDFPQLNAGIEHIFYNEASSTTVEPNSKRSKGESKAALAGPEKKPEQMNPAELSSWMSANPAQPGQQRFDLPDQRTDVSEPSSGDKIREGTSDKNKFLLINKAKPDLGMTPAQDAATPATSESSGWSGLQGQTPEEVTKAEEWRIRYEANRKLHPVPQVSTNAQIASWKAEEEAIKLARDAAWKAKLQKEVVEIEAEEAAEALEKAQRIAYNKLIPILATDPCSGSTAAVPHQEPLKGDDVNVTYEATTWSCKHCKACTDIDYTNCNECKFPKPNTPEPNDWLCACGLSNRVRHKECINFMFHNHKNEAMPLQPGTNASSAPWLAGKKNTFVAKSPFLVYPQLDNNLQPIKATSSGPQAYASEPEKIDKTIITMTGAPQGATRPEWKWRCSECDYINDGEKASMCTSCGKTTAPPPPRKAT